MVKYLLAISALLFSFSSAVLACPNGEGKEKKAKEQHEEAN